MPSVAFSFFVCLHGRESIIVITTAGGGGVGDALAIHMYIHIDREILRKDGWSSGGG